MSTNPFRQIRSRPNQPDTSSTINLASDSQRTASDGSDLRAADLSLDTKAPSSLDRHVSFASPPVDSTIPAASYPSSPESTRFSPPFQSAQPVTPNYRTAPHSDPFEALGRHIGQDNPIQEALTNAQSNASIGQTAVTRSEEALVQDTPSSFASDPQPVQQPVEFMTVQSAVNVRPSLDVEAFKRLLLTGDSGQNTPGTTTPPSSRHNTRVLSDNSSSTDTTSLSQQSIFDGGSRNAESTPRSSHEHERDDQVEDGPKVAPPAPAPRRGKSVKAKPATTFLRTEVAHPVDLADVYGMSTEMLSKKPPTPPLARRQIHRTTAFKHAEAAEPPADVESPTESVRTSQKAPPPLPVRRQHPISQRRPSYDLTTTIEESGAEPSPAISSRRSSNDRPMPPPSRNSSTSNKRQSLGLMSPPPLPPPRKGRGSSRSSMDSFRPSLASIMGEGAGHDNAAMLADSQRSTVDDQMSLNATNADSIMAELAKLQKEVDAARRGA